MMSESEAFTEWIGKKVMVTLVGSLNEDGERLDGIERRLAEMEVRTLPIGRMTLPASDSQVGAMYINGELWRMCNRCRAHYPPGHVCVFCER